MKAVNIILYVIAAVMITAPLGGCEKTSVNSRYVIEPFVQTKVKIDDREVDTMYHNIKDVVVHMFFVSDPDTLIWAPVSFEGALSGVIKDVDGNEKNADDTKDGSAATDADTVLVFDNVNKLRFMLVACDKVNKIYGYRAAEITVNLAQAWIPVTFRESSNRKEEVYQKWYMVNESVREEPEEPDNPDDPGSGGEGGE